MYLWTWNCVTKEIRSQSGHQRLRKPRSSLFLKNSKSATLDFVRFHAFSFQRGENSNFSLSTTLHAMGKHSERRQSWRQKGDSIDESQKQSWSDVTFAKWNLYLNCLDYGRKGPMILKVFPDRICHASLRSCRNILRNASVRHHL